MITSKALRLFHCFTCGATDLRWIEFVPAPEPMFKGHEISLPVHCESCSDRMDQVLNGVGADLLPESFEVDGETIGRNPGKVRISSLRELRAIERESEQKHRDKSGTLINFREFTQDRGNRHRNSFEGSSYQQAKSRRVERPRTVSNLSINVRPVRE